MTPRSRLLLLAGGAAAAVSVAVPLRRSSQPEAEGQASSAAPPKSKPTPPGAPATLAAPPMSPPSSKVLTSDGKGHRFVERRYEPPYPLPARAPPYGQSDTPEDAAAAYLSAMAAVDWDGAWSRWAEKDRAGSKTPEADKRKILDLWTRELRGRAFVLLRRIDVEGYVILYYRRADRGDDDPLAKTPIALARDQAGHWWLTQDLGAHPVFGYDCWREGVDVRVVEP